jgi:hypothetical protein
MCSGGTTHAGLTMDKFNGGYGLAYNWNDDLNTYNFSPNLDGTLPDIADSTWTYVALVINPAYAAIYVASPAQGGFFCGDE